MHCRQLAGELLEALQPFAKKINIVENMRRAIGNAQKAVEEAAGQVSKAAAEGALCAIYFNIDSCLFPPCFLCMFSVYFSLLSAQPQMPRAADTPRHASRQACKLIAAALWSCSSNTLQASWGGLAVQNPLESCLASPRMCCWMPFMVAQNTLQPGLL